MPYRLTPELRSEHEINMILACVSPQDIDVHNGELLAFGCQRGDLDDGLLEGVHDYRCPLDDNPGPLTDNDDVPVQHRWTDGGR